MEAKFIIHGSKSIIDRKLCVSDVEGRQSLSPFPIPDVSLVGGYLCRTWAHTQNYWIFEKYIQNSEEKERQHIPHEAELLKKTEQEDKISKINISKSLENISSMGKEQDIKKILLNVSYETQNCFKKEKV